jgi:hypothetical protein
MTKQPWSPPPPLSREQTASMNRQRLAVAERAEVMEESTGKVQAEEAIQIGGHSVRAVASRLIEKPAGATMHVGGPLGFNRSVRYQAAIPSISDQLRSRYRPPSGGCSWRSIARKYAAQLL